MRFTGLTTLSGVVHFRLSSAELSAIWPGLDLLVKSNISRGEKGGCRFEYPFRIYPPPTGFDRGKFNLEFMNQVRALWKYLHPKSQAGSKVQMDTIDIRASIFSIRVNLDSVRKRNSDFRRDNPRTEVGLNLDENSYRELKIKSQQVIVTFEGHMKRANRALLAVANPEVYEALMCAWTAHLRWMRLHLAYFKPLPKVVPGRRHQQLKDLDELVSMAKHGVRSCGFYPPDEKDLRKMMRLYVRSARRGREGIWTARHLLDGPRDATRFMVLGEFVVQRMVLKELPER